MPFTNTTPSLPFVSNSETSRDAALKALRFVGPQGRAVRAFVRERGAYGATQKEIADVLEMSRASVCARVRALEQTGDVVKSVSERRESCAVYFINER